MKQGGGRVKGRTFELKIARQISDHCKIEFGRHIRRTPNSGALTTRSDLWVSINQRHKFFYFVEMKSYAASKWTLEGISNSKFPPRIWFNEAVSKLPLDPDYVPETPVLLIFKKNNLSALVMVSRDVLLSQWDNNKSRFSFYLEDNVNNVFIMPWDEFLEVFVPKGV